MNVTTVKIVSFFITWSVGFTFIVVLFLRVLNFCKSCGYINADSGEIMYFCRRGW